MYGWTKKNAEQYGTQCTSRVVTFFFLHFCNFVTTLRNYTMVYLIFALPVPGPVSGITFPRVTNLEVDMTWQPPEEPNGVIEKYKVRLWEVFYHYVIFFFCACCLEKWYIYSGHCLHREHPCEEFRKDNIPSFRKYLKKGTFTKIP